MNDWMPIDTGNAVTVLEFPNRTHLEQARLLEWVWVIDLSRFVRIDNPTETLSEKQFNDLYADLNLDIEPSKVIREVNRKDRVVYRIDSFPDDRRPLVPIGGGLLVLNSFPHPPKEIPATVSSISDDALDLFLDHLRYICNDSEEAVEHLLKWMAHLLFRPEVRMTHGILISGKQGTGKSLIAEVIKKLVGERGSQTISPQMLKGQFHDWMVGAYFNVVEELREYEDHALYNRIKPYFTDEKLHINPKGLPSYQIRNNLHFFMLSNHPYPIQIEDGDRRIFYLHSRAEKKDRAYYDELWRCLFDDDGIWRLFHYLRDVILPTVPENFAFEAPPETEDHSAAVDASRHPIEELFIRRREEGEDIFQPRVYFEWADLAEQIKDAGLEYCLRNRQTTHGVLTKCGLIRRRWVLDGKKRDFCWFEDFDEELREFRLDTSNAGRERLRNHLAPNACTNYF